jgi:hypothetical protein
MARGTHIAPYRHLDPLEAESFLLLQGEIASFMFDDAVTVASAYILRDATIGIDIDPDICTP